MTRRLAVSNRPYELFTFKEPHPKKKSKMISHRFPLPVRLF